jgi:membrane protein DedA with SNARE-associated domain
VLRRGAPHGGASNAAAEGRNSLEHVATELIAFIKANPGWSVLVIGVTAFGESFAFLSLLFPGTAILVAAGGLAAVGAIPFFSSAVAGIFGAVLGDAISFWLGQKFGPLLPRMWPFRNNPAPLQRGIQFFQRYGSASVFIGRFFGPVRAVVPLAAGMMRMPTALFYIANIASAIVWAPVLLLSGALIARSVVSSNHVDAALLAVAAAAMVVVAIVYWARRRIREG